MLVKVKNYLYQTNSQTQRACRVGFEIRIKHQLESTTYKFKKEERLCSKKLIDALFEKGVSSGVYPVKAVHLKTELELPYAAQVMFVVPKKSFKKAHDRNKLKRRMREAYRKQKPDFYLALGERKKLIAFIYYSKKEEKYEQIEKAIKSQLLKIQKA